MLDKFISDKGGVMAESQKGKGYCGIILSCCITPLLIWITLRTSLPSCSIQDFYVPALNKSANSTHNLTLYFNLKLQNQMKDKGVHYANITLTFSYINASATPLPVAVFTVPDFYQGHKKSTSRKALVEARDVPWAAAIRAASDGSTANFTVRLAAKVKFKIWFWYTKRHGLAVAGDVPVDGTGKKVNKKGIKLKSRAPDPNDKRVWVGFLGILGLWLFLFL